jgi:hypothetical protein
MRTVAAVSLSMVVLGVSAGCHSSSDLGAGAPDGGVDRPPAAADASRARVPWEQQIITNGTWLVDGTMPSALVRRDCQSSIWPQLNPAQWIWSDPCEAGDRETRLLLKTFELPEAPDSATLEARVDDYAYVSINDHAFPTECMLKMGSISYGPATICGFNDPYVRNVTTLLRAGENTIRVMVHNAPIDLPNGATNPAGLVLRLTVRGGQL